MDIKFDKDNEGEQTPAPAPSGDKNRQSILLVLLLILVGGFGYLYFFTGILKPQEAQKQPEAPPPQVVKKPMPAREGEAAKGAAPDKKAAESAKPEPPKVAKAEPQSAAPVPVKPPEKTKEEPKKPEPAKTAEKRPMPAPPSKAGQPVQAVVPVKPEGKKPVAEKPEEKKATPVKPSDKKVSAVKPDEKLKADKKQVKAKEPEKKDGDRKKASSSAKPPAKKAPESSGIGSWTVVVNSYTLEEALSADMARVKKAGLEPSVKAGTKKKTNMHRLFVAEYDSKEMAQAELQKLKKHTSDAFVMQHGGKYAVYAGSYVLDARASSEMERLGASGIKLTQKRAEVAIPTKQLTAGTYRTRAAADEAVAKLRKEGMKPSVEGR